MLYQNVPQKTLQEIKQYVANVNIDCTFNYPRKQLNVPAIVILLKSESEAEQFLGDYMGDSVDQDMIYDTSGGHGGSVSDLDGLQEPIVQGLLVEGSTSTEITIDTASAEEYLEAYLSLVQGGNYQVYVVRGTGAGQVRNILTVTSESIDIDVAFDVNLDSTSYIDIRTTGEVATEGEPSRVYDQDSFYERKGVHYKVQYQLQIIAGHQNEVIYLYSIIKALLLSQRPFLEGQGLMVFELSGSDLAPRGEYLPSEVFMRVLNMSFTYPFSFVQTLGNPVPRYLDVVVQPDNLGIPGSGDPTITVGTFTLG